MKSFYKSSLALAASAALALGSASAQAAPLFTFETDAFDASSPFASTSQGLTATFAGSAFADPGAFAISFNSTSGPLPLYARLSGGLLTTSLSSLDPSSPLRIIFSQPVTSISLAYALGSRTGTLSLSTNGGGSVASVGSVSTGYSYAEGLLSFSGAAFTVATLSTQAAGLAVDNIGVNVAAAAVPEPATLLLVSGLVAGAGLLRRRSAV